jgi:hypothetical protein
MKNGEIMVRGTFFKIGKSWENQRETMKNGA